MSTRPKLIYAVVSRRYWYVNWWVCNNLETASHELNSIYLGFRVLLFKMELFFYLFKTIHTCSYGLVIWTTTHYIPPELKIKETTDTTSASILISIHYFFVTNGTLSTTLYDKCDEFDFRIVNFPYICRNIPESPVYAVYISKVIRYARAFSSYVEFIDRGALLTKKLVLHFLWSIRLFRSFCVT